jgi:hypothetical protein
MAQEPVESFRRTLICHGSCFVIRGVVSVILGFVVASIVMLSIEFLNARVFYPGFAELAEAKDREAEEEARKGAPNGVADEQAVLLRRREAVRQLLADAPVGALVVVVCGCAIGSLAGGYVAARVSERSPLMHAIVLGAALTLAGVANNMMLPPPAWFWVAMLSVFIPGAGIGARIASRRRAA